MIEVGGETDFGAVNLSGDGKSLCKGVEEVGFGVIDVLDGNSEVKVVLLNHFGSHTTESNHLFVGFCFSPSGWNGT